VKFLKRLKRPDRAAPQTSTAALAITVAYGVLLYALIVGGEPACVELVVWSSNEKANTLQDVARAYTPPAGRRCVNLHVERVESGAAETALAEDRAIDGQRPHVWAPAAETWLLLLGHHRNQNQKSDIIPRSWDNLMKSPLVIAMPIELADTLQVCYPNVGWRQVLDVARSPERCLKYLNQHGRFRLAKTNPNVSTSGLHALIGTYNAARNKSAQLTLEDVRDGEAQRFVQGVELGVVHYADSVRDFLVALYKEDQAGRALSYVSAIAVEEKQVFEYNRGNPASEPFPNPPSGGLPPDKKLKAIYPEGGTLVADHPYVVLNAPWVGAAQRQAALDFLEYLKGNVVQERFRSEGYRDRFSHADPDVLTPPYFDPHGHATVAVPTEPVLAEIQSSWSALRKRANILLLFDVGSSLTATLPGAGTKLDAAKVAMANAVKTRLAADDAVGLWTFPARSAARSQDGVREIAPRGSGEGIAAELADLTPVDGRRQLYLAVRTAVEEVRSQFATDKINAVVVISDADDETARPNDLTRLLDDLRSQPEDGRVRVFTIAYGAAARGALIQIAEASKGLYQDATTVTDVPDMDRVLRRVISNF
jgi:Ca-activated chloride channel family protein